jgi:predicted TIM-barrel fold metal-dependent hydrolase
MLTTVPIGSLTRRDFLGASVAAGAALAGPSQSAAWAAPTGQSGAGAGKKAPVIDCHAHLSFRKSPDEPGDDLQVLDAADRLGIDRLCCSILCKRPASVEGFRACNAALAAAIKRHPRRLLGYCYVNPEHGREALDEIRRCMSQDGFIGVKLYNERLCTDPIVAPIVELAIRLGAVILHHAGHGHAPFPDQPNISDGGHLAKLGCRYPEARLICAHVGGGGDWEWTIKALRHARNVYLDTSGSVIDEGIVELAAKTLGVDRLLFGCDMSFTAGVGKIRGANLSAEQKQQILSGNLLRLLEDQKRKKA